MYTSYFEDDYGNVSSKELCQPKIAHLLFDYLPLIDEHNKQQQKILGLEMKWPMRNCWFRLLTTLVGMCMVDLHQLYCNLQPQQYRDMDIIQFSDLLCKKLSTRSNRQNTQLAILRRQGAEEAVGLEHITDRDGNSCYGITNRQVQ